VTDERNTGGCCGDRSDMVCVAHRGPATFVCHCRQTFPRVLLHYGVTSSWQVADYTREPGQSQSRAHVSLSLSCTASRPADRRHAGCMHACEPM
jgi:hypothetical protein